MGFSLGGPWAEVIRQWVIDKLPNDQAVVLEKRDEIN